MVSPGNFRLYKPMKMPWVIETVSGMGPPLPQVKPYLIEESHVNTDSDNIV